MNLKDWLKDKLFENEIKLLKKSYDIIGDIAIIEIPEELKKKQKLIGNSIIENVKIIKTVVKKVGSHEGEFRLQKHKVIAGENKKETTFKENNAVLNINIDKTYFSIRSSTERLRISKLVKDNEYILTMFSGIAPYPIVISKNSNARYIYGIELNKNAHILALKNAFQNKSTNVFLINGDAKKINHFYNLIIGFKTALHEKEYLAKYNFVKKYNKTPIVELFITKEDLEMFNSSLFYKIKKNSSKLIVHKVKSKDTRNIDEDIDSAKKTLDFIVKNKIEQYVDKVILHAPNIIKEEYKTALYKTNILFKNYDKILIKKISIENLPFGYFEDPNAVLGFIKDLKLNSLCYDMGHHVNYLFKTFKTYIALKKKIIEFLDSIDNKQFDVYFHLMNCKIPSESEDLNYLNHNQINKDQIKIIDHLKLSDDFLFKFVKTELMQRISYGIIECMQNDELNPLELKESFEFLNNMDNSNPKTFDRILMPLPKDSELFLEHALSVSKTGTIIHLYHFSNIDEIPEFKLKLLNLAKNFNHHIKIFNVERCGDFSPKVYRFCFDIEVIN